MSGVPSGSAAHTGTDVQQASLLDRVPAVFYVVEHERPIGPGRLLFLSPQVEPLTGYPASAFLADPGLERRIIHPDDLAGKDAAERRHLAGGEPLRIDYRIVARDGTVTWVHDEATLLRRDDGPLFSHGLILDMSRQKRLEAQLREAQKQEAIGRLAGGIAHDFNNLLTAIIGYVDLLLADLENGAAGTAELVEIRRATERASALTRQLLSFARRQPLNTRVVDLGQIVTGIEPLLRRVIGEDVELTVSVAPEAFVRVDPAQLEQVIVNLAVNARDAMPAGGALTIAVDVQPERRRVHRGAGNDGDQVILRVADSGEGMDEQTRVHAFEPFFTTKAPGRGTGLGLATVYGIVTASGGTVTIESRVEGGTTVVVALPRAAAEPAPATEPARREIPRALAATGGARTILVVEDEDAVRQLVRTVLGRQGFTVVDVPNGAAALEWVASRSEPVDLLVTDLVMPGMNGREVAERLSSVSPGLPVLFLSGYTADVLRGRPPLGPGQSFLAKPFSPDELVATVHAILAEPRAEAASA